MSDDKISMQVGGIEMFVNPDGLTEGDRATMQAYMFQVGLALENQRLLLGGTPVEQPALQALVKTEIVEVDTTPKTPDWLKPNLIAAQQFIGALQDEFGLNNDQVTFISTIAHIHEVKLVERSAVPIRNRDHENQDVFNKHVLGSYGRDSEFIGVITGVIERQINDDDIRAQALQRITMTVTEYASAIQNPASKYTRSEEWLKRYIIEGILKTTSVGVLGKHRENRDISDKFRTRIKEIIGASEGYWSGFGWHELFFKLNSLYNDIGIDLTDLQRRITGNRDSDQKLIGS